MSTYTPRPYRACSLLQVFDIPRPPVREHLCTHFEGMDAVQFESNAFTLVLNRDVRRSVEIASGMAMFVAKKFPERRVLLINTYAGDDLLQDSLARSFERCQIERPQKVEQFLANAPKQLELPDPLSQHYPEEIRALEAQQKQERERVARADEVALANTPTAEADVLPNFRVLSFPTGFFDPETVRAELGEGTGQIVVWNSFEFSAFGIVQRMKVAQAMIALQQVLRLSVLVFSHQMRHDLQAFNTARGAIGLIAAYASIVSRLMTEIEWVRWIREEQALQRISRTRSGNGAIHEPRMHSLQSSPPPYQGGGREGVARDRQNANHNCNAKIEYDTPFSDYAAAEEARQKAVANGEMPPPLVKPF